MSEPHDSEIGGDLPPLDPVLAAWLEADDPGPMPDEVWASIQARLAQEPPLVPAGVVDLGAVRSRRRSRTLPVLAGAAGLVLVGAVVLPSLGSPDPAPVADGVVASGPVLDPTSPAPGGESAEPVAATPTTSQEMQGTAAPDPASPGGATAGVEQVLPRAMLSTGTSYTTDALPAQVVTLLADAGMGDGVGVSSAMTASPAPTQMLGTGLAASPESLADCLGRLGLPVGTIPLVLDTAIVDGREGSVIVTTSPPVTDGQPTALHVVAVGQDCTDADVAAARHWDLPLR